VPTHTRTVMFTDLTGFTEEVSRSDREGLRRILHEHEGVVAPIVKRFRGRVIKNLGDSFLCLFDSATDAVRAGLDILESLGTVAVQERSPYWPVVPDGDVRRAHTLRLRIGLATGDVEEIDGDAFGETVNLAARVLSKTQDGQLWFSPATRLCMNAAEISWEPVGQFELKGIPGGVELFRAVPANRCWLPEPVSAAARRGRLVRIARGERIPALPVDATILLTGFLPGSPELRALVDELPMVEPSHLWMATSHISTADRMDWLHAGRGLVIGAPSAVDVVLGEIVGASTRPSIGDTIIFDMQASLFLMLGGIALPAVPLADVVESYTYDLAPDGRWMNRVDNASVRVEVTPEGVRLHVTSPGVHVDGRGRGLDEVVPLRDGARVEIGGATHTFLALDGEYCGILVSDSTHRIGVSPGHTVEIGREPTHPGLMLVDRRGAANLRWCPGSKAARAREGGFTLDRALAGRRQAAVSVGALGPEVVPLHDRCATWRLSAEQADGAASSASDATRPRVLERVHEPRQVGPGDHLVVGTWVVTLVAPT
jgi:class 3 adenylate cyclase